MYISLCKLATCVWQAGLGCCKASTYLEAFSGRYPVTVRGRSHAVTQSRSMRCMFLRQEFGFAFVWIMAGRQSSALVLQPIFRILCACAANILCCAGYKVRCTAHWLVRAVGAASGCQAARLPVSQVAASRAVVLAIFMLQSHHIVCPLCSSVVCRLFSVKSLLVFPLHFSLFFSYAWLAHGRRLQHALRALRNGYKMRN